MISNIIKKEWQTPSNKRDPLSIAIGSSFKPRYFISFPEEKLDWPLPSLFKKEFVHQKIRNISFDKAFFLSTIENDTVYINDEASFEGYA